MEPMLREFGPGIWTAKVRSCHSLDFLIRPAWPQSSCQRRTVRLVARRAFPGAQTRDRRTGTGSLPRLAQSAAPSFSQRVEGRLSRCAPLRFSGPAMAAKGPCLRRRLGRRARSALGGGHRSGSRARQFRDDGGGLFPSRQRRRHLRRLDPKLPSRLVQWLARPLARFAGIVAPHPGAPRDWRASFTNRSAARAALERILAWPIERVLMAHGEPVYANGAAFVRDAFGWLLGRRRFRAPVDTPETMVNSGRVPAALQPLRTPAPKAPPPPPPERAR